MPETTLTRLQKRARRWLITNDPTPEKFWETAPDTSDFIGDVYQNRRDFGPSRSADAILKAAREAGWSYNNSRPAAGTRKG